MHRSQHELVKQWHGEFHIAVGRAVDHALLHKVRPRRTNAVDLHAYLTRLSLFRAENDYFRVVVVETLNVFGAIA